mgnify:CR=1 FL=1
MIRKFTGTIVAAALVLAAGVFQANEARADNDTLKGAVIGAGVGGLIGGKEGAVVGGVGGAIIGSQR